MKNKLKQKAPKVIAQYVICKIAIFLGIDPYELSLCMKEQDFYIG